MTQADSVHSTPPTNTSTTRRNILSTIAAAGATALTLTPARAAAPAPDPIYAAIERHKALTVPFDAAWDARGHFNDSGECDEKPSDELRRLNDAIDAAGPPMEEAAYDLFNTVPTTPAGIVAAIRVIQIYYSAGDNSGHMPRGQWLYEDEDDPRNGRDWLECFLDTIADAVDAMRLDQAVQS
jgi:hypothetical protein